MSGLVYALLAYLGTVVLVLLVVGVLAVCGWDPGYPL